MGIATSLVVLPGCWFMMPAKVEYTSTQTAYARSDGAHAIQKVGFEEDVLVILDHKEKPIGRVENADPKGQIAVIPDREHTGSHYLLVPVVTPEPRTKVLHVAGRAGDPHELLSFSEVRELPRVTALKHSQGDVPIFTIRAPASPASEPPLFVPLGGDLKPIALPTGVLGVRPVSDETKRAQWDGWYVRWQDGWSTTRDPDLSRFSNPGPRWKSVVVKEGLGNLYFTGTLPDGQCEAETIEETPYREPRPTAASCDQAIAMLHAGIMKYWIARNEAMAKPSSTVQEPSPAEVEAKRVQEVEKAAFIAYRTAVSIQSYATACSEGRKMRPEVHAKVVAWRCSLQACHGEEFFCYKGRQDANRADTEFLEKMWSDVGATAAREKEAELQRRLNRHTYTPGQGTGGPSAAERLKQTSDYNYGSGRASSCPMTDASLCN